MKQLPVNRQAELCEQFPWDLDIRWYGHTGIHQMPARRVAQILLKSEGGRQLDTFNVQIISKSQGVIAWHNFPIHHYIPNMDELEKATPQAGTLCREIRSYIKEFY